MWVCCLVCDGVDDEDDDDDGDGDAYVVADLIVVVDVLLLAVWRR